MRMNLDYRKDIPTIIIPINLIDEFKKGHHIKKRIPGSWRLNIGDKFLWECADQEGIGRVVKIEKDLHVIQKVTTF